MAELVLFPHCDIHVALAGTPALRLAVFTREPADPPTHFVLTPVTGPCAYDFFAPHNPVGSRFQQFVNINPAGDVTPTAVGTNLVQISHDGDYIVARIQVHANLLGWWFGNASITTAVDAQFAHAQPSIYALFSDEPSGTDLVGDVTGHGYIPLTSSDTTKFTIAPHGRLQGRAEGAAAVSGTFLGVTHQLPVQVVQYVKPRNTLDGVQVPDLADAAEMHNVLFLSEGFRDTDDDRESFDAVVTEAVDEMFDKPRHQPYAMLEGGFNVFKAFQPSPDHGLTIGFRVNDRDADGGVLPKGRPIPYDGRVSPDPQMYTPDLLVRKVGLPRRGENRDTSALIAEWNSQTLSGFEPARVDDAVVNAWKVQRSDGILEARDTFFGLQLGGRPGERVSGTGVVPRPAADAAGDPALPKFVGRVYEWFALEAARTLIPDPRRHPPELVEKFSGHGSSIHRYLGTLHWRFGSQPNVGAEWVPEVAVKPTVFRPSVGLVAIVCNEHLLGGTNFQYATANTVGKDGALEFELTSAGNERPMRRKLPTSISPDTGFVTDTVAHEFGHTFNLADEYEELLGDDDHMKECPGTDFVPDNATRLAMIHLHGVVQPNGTIEFPDRQIDPAKVKWLNLPRAEVCDRLLADSVAVDDGIQVTIDRRFVGPWVAAKKLGHEACLRQRTIAPDNQQLPLPTGPAEFLDHLTIKRFDEAAGTVVLGGPALPSPPPVFPKGSHAFVQRRTSAGDAVVVVERKVLEKLNATHSVLNSDPDRQVPNKEDDTPVDIADLTPPCKSYKLVGVYEGARGFPGGIYRPTGLCKMRKADDEGVGEGGFCHVCKYLLVNRVNPGLHALLDKLFYPRARDGGDG